MTGLTDFKGNIIHVGVAEWKTGGASDALRTTLGSCVGIVLYSSKKKAGGIAHILLAEPPAGRIVNKAKYASTATLALAAELNRIGVENGDLTARLFGGASMFETVGSNFMNNIGTDNVNAARKAVESLMIPVIAEDVGGTVGRTITLFMDDGRLLLRAGGKEKYIYKA